MRCRTGHAPQALRGSHETWSWLGVSSLVGGARCAHFCFVIQALWSGEIKKPASINNTMWTTRAEFGYCAAWLAIHTRPSIAFLWLGAWKPLQHFALQSGAGRDTIGGSFSTNDTN